MGRETTNAFQSTTNRYSLTQNRHFPRAVLIFRPKVPAAW